MSRQAENGKRILVLDQGLHVIYRVAGMLQTLLPDEFQAYVREKEKARREKIDGQRNLNVWRLFVHDHYRFLSFLCSWRSSRVRSR